MKLLCVNVLVIICCVPFAYAVNTEYTSYANGPANDYSKFNTISQNTYQPIVPVTSKLYGNVLNQYPTTQENNIIGQPPSNQLDNRIGPGLQIPYQEPQSNRGLQYSTPINRQINNAASQLPQQVSAPDIRRLASNPYLRAIHTSRPKNKRYTIIHPNGVVEHTDEIHAVKARYPNYIMVKAADIIGNVEQKDDTPINSQLNSPSTNAYQGVSNTQQTNTNLWEPRQSSDFIKKAPLKQQTATEVPNWVAPATLNPPHYQNQQWNSDYSYQRENYNQKANQQYFSGVSAEKIPETEPRLLSDNLFSSKQQQIWPLDKQIKENSPYESQEKQKNLYIKSGSYDKTEVLNSAQLNDFTSKQNIDKISINTSLQDSTNATPQETIVEKGQNESPITENLHETVVASNPLPIYPTSFELPSSTNSDKPYESPTIISQSAHLPQSESNNEVDSIESTVQTRQESIVPANSDSSAPITENGIQMYPVDQPASSNPAAIDLNETLPVILPEAPPLNDRLQEIQTPNTIQEPNQIDATLDTTTINETPSSDNTNSAASTITETNNNTSASQLPTILEPNEMNEVIDLSLPIEASNRTEESIDTSGLPVNKTNPVEITKEFYIGPEIQNTSPNSTELTSAAIDKSSESESEEPLTWFILTEQWWESLQNHTQNVFVFLPPQPKVIREIKTTTFPNGTSVQEITETVMDIELGGEPKSTKTILEKNEKE